MNKTIEKVCDICGEEFATSKSLKKRCSPECSRIGKNRSCLKTVTVRRQKVAKIIKLFLGGECVICGYDRCDRALEAHHVNPKLKSFTLASQRHSRTLHDTLDEANKCILLCSNCHREYHDGMIEDNIFYEILENDICRRDEFRKDIIQTNEYEKREKINSISKCIYCGTDVSVDARMCNPCYNNHREKIDWPQTEELIRMVKETSYVATARKLGVSDNGVRKRIKNHPVE